MFIPSSKKSCTRIPASRIASDSCRNGPPLTLTRPRTRRIGPQIYIVDRDGTVLRTGPRFIDLEVSAEGDAAPFLLDSAAWAWGDLAFRTMRPVSFYRVYRGMLGGTFRCRFTTTIPEWVGGDPDTPTVGELFAYVVTAVSPGGEETRLGIAAQSFLLDACP